MKRARAKRKVNAEHEMATQKEKEIEKLTQKMEHFKSEVAKQKTIIEHYKVFLSFMDEALEHTGEVRWGVLILAPVQWYCCPSILIYAV